MNDFVCMNNCLQAEKKKMGHSINSIILKGEYKDDEAIKFDLKGIELDFGLNMFLQPMQMNLNLHTYANKLESRYQCK